MVHACVAMSLPPSELIGRVCAFHRAPVKLYEVCLELVLMISRQGRNVIPRWEVHIPPRRLQCLHARRTWGVRPPLVCRS